MYFGVIAVAIACAAVTRLEPRGLAHAMFATAGAQTIVPLIALAAWQPPVDSGVFEVLIVNAFFVVLWVASALLFLRAESIRLPLMD
jgi:hypothetical protein